MVPGLYDTAVIGGGVSGCSVILALGGTVDPGYRAAVFEPGRLGPGVAYGDQPAALLMNGGANTMSLLPDDRYHLLRWLGSNDGNALIARRRFGDYVADTVQRVIASHPGFSHVQSEIVECFRIPEDTFSWTNAASDPSPATSFLPSEILRRTLRLCRKLSEITITIRAIRGT